MERLGLFNKWCRNFQSENFVDLVGQPSPVEEDFEEPTNVAASDDELHEDFLSGVRVLRQLQMIERCQKIRR